MQELDIEKELERFEAEQRAALGLDDKKDHWTDSMIDPYFTASQRATTTMLVGGLTMAHDQLIEGALRGIGYKVRALDCPDTQSLRFGKEFGNKAQCNPTYFTVGNLVKELCRLRDEEGMTSDEVIASHVFVTAGACGPCRFGMYATEYRKALRDAGFDGFRVLLFQQTGGFKQATGEELGLVLNPTFFFALAKALFSGDVINLLGYRIRPYEVEKGATDNALTQLKAEVHHALEHGESVLKALFKGRRLLSAIEVDKLQPKPKVAILGEFWAMTTEGDGNYHLQEFVETEGGENDIQILVNLLLYNLWEIRHDTTTRMKLKGADGGPFGLKDSDVGYTMGAIWLGEIALRATFHAFAFAAGLRGHHLPDMEEVAKYGHSHYNQELRGGEGHMEVAKLIMNTVKQKAHMTLSVKPFGCMPSSGVSDGVQSVITERYPEAIFCAVETSGDGAVNFYSRVQMFLFKARQRAQEEYQQVLASYGLTDEQVRAYVKGSKFAHPLHKAPHVNAGTAADVVHAVAPFVGKSALGRVGAHAKLASQRVKTVATKDVPYAAERFKMMAPYLPAVARMIYTEGKGALPTPKEAWQKLLNRFVEPTPDEVQTPLSDTVAAPSESGTRSRNDNAVHLPLAV
ncbi:MAG: 2-hydroxyglutaryl-CoA dehydratase [Polyangiales bacterium]